VWQKFTNGKNNEIWASFYDVTAGVWGDAERLAVTNTVSPPYRVDLNLIGQSLVVWDIAVDPAEPGIRENWAGYFDLATKTWNKIKLNKPNSQGVVADPAIAANVLIVGLRLNF